jgi:pyruvate,orthophosphate dikinase
MKREERPAVSADGSTEAIAQRRDAGRASLAPADRAASAPTAGYVYRFGDGRADGNRGMKNALGGKGANLAEMCNLGLPVPPGFTITTDVCTWFYEHDHGYPPELEAEVRRALGDVERSMNKRFGDAENPLLVSVRSGARVSMPGMMDTVLNLGLNDATVEGLARRTQNPRFAWDAYRRFVQMYADVVLGLKAKTDAHRDPFTEALEKLKKKRRVVEDTALETDDLRALVKEFKRIVAARSDAEFPDDPWTQLWCAIGAVFGSWNCERAIAYRALNHIPASWGTAVNVVAMVFGNMGPTSGTGVAFTRDPSTGEKRFYGEYLMNAQGEDVVAGIRTPLSIESLSETSPAAWRELVRIQALLEHHYRDMQDLEFTIEEGKLYMLQCRSGKRTGFAAVRIAVDMVREQLIDERQALLRVEPEALEQLLQPVFAAEEVAAARKDGRVLTRGLNAGPGAATGRLVFSAATAVEWKRHGESVILARIETSPDDILGMQAAAGVLTARGGMTSHAALVARQMGKVCVAGAGDIVIDYKHKRMTIGGRTFAQGDWISIDGSTGEVYEGRVSTAPSEVLSVLFARRGIAPVDGSQRIAGRGDRTGGDGLDPSHAVAGGNGRASTMFEAYSMLMQWADAVRRLRVRANADQPDQCQNAIAFGAEGVGLCRTEHMFFAEGKIEAVREMILADNGEERVRALARLLPLQRDDFEGIFRAMGPRPVTIRTLDPPLHEFLPHDEPTIKKLAKEMGVKASKLRAKVESLREQNPMLGHRGCRLGILYPEITIMQARAIFEAACNVAAASGHAPELEIMIPLVGTRAELDLQADVVRTVADDVFRERGTRVAYMIGTMIELPRAALTAGDIARTAEFFSFGTNDLTQTTFGISRDDGNRFLPYYVERKIHEADPFATLDREGVGRLMHIAVTEGRATRENLKIGICGEHGGDPRSIAFCHDIGLDYVSCSPFRVPLARLAAAQSALLQP